jgi:energy-coupling factor transporter ATP-binding protein EcfA2
MREPIKLTVHGLFGQLSHEVRLNHEDRVTILTGPNGCGKTHLLNILAAVVSLDSTALVRLPFERAHVLFSDDAHLSVARLDTGEPGIDISAGKGKVTFGSVRLLMEDLHRRLDVPDRFERIDRDRWVDIAEGRTVSDLWIRRNFSRSQKLPEQYEFLREFQTFPAPTLVATRRLDIDPSDFDERSAPSRRRREAEARILSYVERIRSQIAEARRASLAVSQRADRGFASRALDKARASVNEGELRKRYESLSSLHQSLHANALTEESVGVEFPSGRTNPTERRILNLFLDDWEEKLSPLQPVHEKLQLLRAIVGEKLVGKSLVIDTHGELSFQSESGQQISVDMLSSGEQHLLALFTMLLFAAGLQSLVLIDEPEISLHAAWKHAFLDDVLKVVAVNRQKVVLATHSTGIINGRWDLVQELVAPQ